MFLQYGLVLISIVRLGVGQICRPVAAFDIENACDFKPNLVLFLPRVNLTLTERNCNSVVDAKAFSRQPIVKYPGAALVRTKDISLKILSQKKNYFTHPSERLA